MLTNLDLETSINASCNSPVFAHKSRLILGRTCSRFFSFSIYIFTGGLGDDSLFEVELSLRNLSRLVEP